VKHKIRHTIETTGRPVFAKARRLDPDKLRKAEAEFRELEAAGIIRHSDSPWSSLLHMVRKKDISWRPCGDYCRLNLATTHDRYPLPSILDLSNKLHGCKFSSCIDLVKGYHQIPMAAQDIAKTAIITPFGLFEYQDGVRPLQQHVQAISDFPLPPSERPRQPWRPRHHWRTQPRTPCSPSPQTPQTHMSAAFFNS
jgi:hypothetical protein